MVDAGDELGSPARTTYINICMHIYTYIHIYICIHVLSQIIETFDAYMLGELYVGS